MPQKNHNYCNQNVSWYENIPHNALAIRALPWSPLINSQRSREPTGLVGSGEGRYGKDGEENEGGRQEGKWTWMERKAKGKERVKGRTERKIRWKRKTNGMKVSVCFLLFVLKCFLLCCFQYMGSPYKRSIRLLGYYPSHIIWMFCLITLFCVNNVCVWRNKLIDWLIGRWLMTDERWLSTMLTPLFLDPPLLLSIVNV